MIVERYLLEEVLDRSKPWRVMKQDKESHAQQRWLEKDGLIPLQLERKALQNDMLSLERLEDGWLIKWICKEVGTFLIWARATAF